MPVPMPAPETTALRVVITGGLGALGRAVGAELAARCQRVVLLDRAATAEVPGVVAVFGGVDGTDEAAVAQGLAQAAEQLGGGIDSLVNIAGGFAWETLDAGSAATWDRMYSMNLRTAVVACQQALPLLRASGRGSIVNVGALAAGKAAAGIGAYAASKAGVARLTEALAEENKDHGVRVNAVLPSTLDTPANRVAMPDADASRWVAPRALAAVIAFLISDDASAVTGASLPVTGRV
jgi:NAD(P)-dependent dehydrogenase (short-subunit alcohol dehydrogenase family)